MQMEMYKKEHGKMIKLMVGVYKHIQMVLNMSVIGKKINKMEKGLKHGQMVLNKMVNMSLERNTELVHLIGLMEVYMRDIFMIIIYKEEVNKHGVIIEFMKENGKITKCMEMEYLNGQTEENRMENILTIKSKVLEHSHGQMVENT